MKKIQDEYNKCLTEADAEIKEFLNSDVNELYSKPFMSKAGRKAWHTLAEKYGLHSASTGEGESRYVVISKQVIKANGKPLLMTPTAQKYFRDNFDLKINVSDYEDFEYFVELFNAKHLLDIMISAISKFPNEQAWINHINEVKVRVWKSIKSTDAYQRYINFDTTNFVNSTNDIKKKFNVGDSYLEIENNGKKFVSIDIRSANFNSLFWLEKEIFVVDNVQINDWLSFVVLFSTDYPEIAEFIKRSKLFRQKIFWELEPKKQSAIFEYLVTKLIPTVTFPFKNVYHVGDEVIFEVDDTTDMNIHKFEKSLDPKLYRLRTFTLYQIAKNKNWLLRRYDDNNFDIKRCNTIEYAIIWKTIKKLPINDRDLKENWNHSEKKWDLFDLNKVDWLLPI